uniref:Uncharacterized protein LOC116947073 n=1 Tax=Petromyzon marinus TaxID=7757 RepID=A0AAJ7TKP9_PETMA|nr:uncharacterized protein LOC116947073 [Petromyzon marinus]
MGAGSSTSRTRVRRIAVSQLPPAAATGDPATTPATLKTGPFERNRVPFSPGHAAAAAAAGVRPSGVSAAWGSPGVPAGDPRAELPRVRAPRGMEGTTRHAGPRSLPSLPRLLPRSFGAVVAIAPAGETSTKACSSSSSIIHAHPPRLVRRLQEPLPSASSSTPHEAPSRQGQRAPISNLGGLVTRVPDDAGVAGVAGVGLHGVPIRELQSSDDSELDSWTSKHGATRRATTMTSRRRRKRMRTRRYGQGEGTEERGTGRGLVRTHAEEIPMIDAFFDQPLPALT